MDVETLSERISTFVEIGNYHAAVNIAISGLNECRRNSDRQCADMFLGIIRDILRSMEREFGSQEYLENRAGNSE